MNIEFKIIPHGEKEWEKSVKLREDVLRKPLNSFFTAEELKAEENNVHIVGFLNDEIIAAAVLVLEQEKIKMQRVAVKSDLRNYNIGSKMMSYCEDFAIKNKYDEIYCHARDTAVKFYLNNYYVSDGDYFEEDGIPHLKMYKEL